MVSGRLPDLEFNALSADRLVGTLSPLPRNSQAAAGLADDDLIAHTLAGNGSAFEHLVRRHRRRVFAIARHFFRNHETVEDMAQETFARAFFFLAGYRRGGSFEQWLDRIAVNNCYNELRRRRRRAEHLLTDLAEDEETWLDSHLAARSFELHLGAGERARETELANRLMARLPAPDRLLLTLLHIEECSVHEISQLTGWSKSKIKSQAFRARHKMRRALTALKLAERRKGEGQRLRAAIS